MKTSIHAASTDGELPDGWTCAASIKYCLEFKTRRRRFNPLSEMPVAFAGQPSRWFAPVDGPKLSRVPLLARPRQFSSEFHF